MGIRGLQPSTDPPSTVRWSRSCADELPVSLLVKVVQTWTPPPLAYPPPSVTGQDRVSQPHHRRRSDARPRASVPVHSPPVLNLLAPPRGSEQDRTEASGIRVPVTSFSGAGMTMVEN